MKTITNKQMAIYWAARVVELEAMRPMRAAEALTIITNCEHEIAALQARLAQARKDEVAVRDTGRVGHGRGALTARDRGNAQAVGMVRRSVYGVHTRICQLEGRAEAHRRIAEETGSGASLTAALNEAQRRASYYAALLSYRPGTAG